MKMLMGLALMLAVLAFGNTAAASSAFGRAAENLPGVERMWVEGSSARVQVLRMNWIRLLDSGGANAQGVAGWICTKDKDYGLSIRLVSFHDAMTASSWSSGTRLGTFHCN